MGIKVPMLQPKKGRLWLNDGSFADCGRDYRNHALS
jgi:hypothetical protein